MLLQAYPTDFSSYDVFIAGSGPAAAMLSARLSSGGKRCLVVETGGLDVEDRIQSEHCAMAGSGHFDGAHWPAHWVRTLSDALFDAVGPIDVSIGLEPANADDQDEMERFVIDRIPGGATVYDILLRTEMAYDPENRVTRSWGRTPSDLPRLSARCVIGQDVFHTVIEYMNLLGHVLIENDAGRLRLDSDTVHRGFGGGGHTMGTTRMGSSRQSGVVDGDCRVHGYRNLFVAGSSVFPTAGYAHPTFTILALSSRLADKIMEEG